MFLHEYLQNSQKQMLKCVLNEKVIVETEKVIVETEKVIVETEKVIVEIEMLVDYDRLCWQKRIYDEKDNAENAENAPYKVVDPESWR